MASKKVKKSKKDNLAKRRKKNTSGIRILTIFTLLMAIVFLSSTVLLFFGMIPTIVLALFGLKSGQTKTLTVGALNLAGCSPFLFKLWSESHTLDAAIVMASDPKSITVMWGGALLGYLIDWALSGLVATIMVSRSEARIKDIAKRKKLLVERWGREVTGDVPLDKWGYPLEAPEEELASAE